jgi:hypothetical protein
MRETLLKNAWLSARWFMLRPPRLEDCEASSEFGRSDRAQASGSDLVGRWATSAPLCCRNSQGATA